jgi:hypothetical protein
LLRLIQEDHHLRINVRLVSHNNAGPVAAKQPLEGSLRQRTVRLIKDSTAAFWGNGRFMALIAAQRYAVFEKELAKVIFYSSLKWLGRIVALRKQVDMLTDKAIEFCGRVAVISLALPPGRGAARPEAHYRPSPAIVPGPGATSGSGCG